MVVGIVFLFVAAVYEWKTYRVPNSLIFGSLIAAFIFAVVAPILVPDRTGGPGSAFVGMLLGGAMLLPLYAKGNLGAGFIKAQAAFGARAGSGLALVPCLTVVFTATLFTIVIGVTVWLTPYRQKKAAASEQGGPLMVFHGQMPLAPGSLLGVMAMAIIQ